MKLKRAANIALFAVVCFALVYAAYRFTRKDDSDRKYAEFYRDKDKAAYDVIFYGTSHVLDGIQPMELWRDYGFTSYNLGNSSEPMQVTEWVVPITFQYHVPKIAVIDVFYIDRAVDLEWTYPFRHLFFDNLPFSRLKLEALRATLPQDKLPEFLVPFILYHGRWDELVTGDYLDMVDSQPCQMGAEFRCARVEPQPYERTTEAYDGELPGTASIYKIVEICRANGVEPVLTCIPSPATREEQMNCNTVYAVAEELGVPFVNMLDDDVVDLNTDCYDNFSHLNPDGALKVTAYIGNWLREHYDLPDRREDPKTADVWNKRLAEYDALFEEVWGDMSLVR